MAQTYEIILGRLVDKFGSEDKCRAYLHELRWPNGVTCPRCDHKSISRIAKRNQYNCDSCRYQFSVTSGTIMHDTHLPLWKWVLAVFMIVTSKKPISANRVKGSLNVQYRTALHMCHRIRAALKIPNGLLSGFVEVEETCVRGKKRPDPLDNQCDQASIQVAGNKTRITVREYMKKYLAERAAFIYTGAGKNSKRKRGRKLQEGDIPTNQIEDAWAHFKGSIFGSRGRISEKYLDPYFDEFEYRLKNVDNPFTFRDAMKKLVSTHNIQHHELVA